MTYQEAINTKKYLTECWKECSESLMGYKRLFDDGEYQIEADANYINLIAERDEAIKKVKEFNKYFMKNFAKQYAMDDSNWSVDQCNVD